MNNFVLRVISSLFLGVIGLGILGSELLKNLIAVLLFVGGVFELQTLRPINAYVVGYALMLGGAVFFMLNMGHRDIFMLLIIAWVHDVSGYFFGKFFKGPKIIPSISPNKTWAGFLGGCVMLIGGLLLFEYIRGGNISYIEMILGSIVLNAICFTGDILESKLKRIYEVKDSGSLIRGHGGVLDRFDAFFFLMFCIGLLTYCSGICTSGYMR